MEKYVEYFNKKTGAVDRKREAQEVAKKLLPYLYKNPVIVADAIKSSVYYSAVKDENGDTSIFGIQTATKWDKIYLYPFTDSDNPTVYECPEWILDVLTPTMNDRANAWRATTREHLTKECVLRFALQVVVYDPERLNGGLYQDGTPIVLERINRKWVDRENGVSYEKREIIGRNIKAIPYGLKGEALKEAVQNA